MTVTTTETTTGRPRPTITDRDGKVWTLVFTVNLIKPLAAALGHDPRQVLTEPDKLIALLADPERLAAVAYLFVPKPPPAVPHPTAEEFAAALDAASLDDAAEGVIRLLCGMYAPRGRADATADAIIATLKESAEKASEETEPEQPAAAA